MRISDWSSDVCSSDLNRRRDFLKKGICCDPLGWEADVADPPPLGEGDLRSMVEGHARCFLSFIRNAAPPVPLHHLRWSPSPCQIGRASCRERVCRYV